VDNLEAVDQRLSRGPFTHIGPSPNGKSLALLTMTSVLWVISADFQRSRAEFDTTTVAGVDGPVRQVEWCGNDAIIVTWDTLVLLVGPFGDTLQCVLFWGPLCVAQPKLDTSISDPRLLSQRLMASELSAPTHAISYRKFQVISAF
jgi:vacuolar protein sorting-associated protein 16